MVQHWLRTNANYKLSLLETIRNGISIFEENAGAYNA